MSASPIARKAVSHSQDTSSGKSLPKSIPKKIYINSPSELPNDYSTTPGGTLFSTTPGGSRIIYERNFLMSLKSSPLAKSPPEGLPKIPGVTVKELNVPIIPGQQNNIIEEEPEKLDDEQFDMDL